jgi:dephospho-CoA kinase
MDFKMKNAIFIVGGPGSGKDILIKNICENYSIPEYTLEQIIKFKGIKETILVKGNAYDLYKISECKRLLEDNYYKTSLIFVDVKESVSKHRLSNRTISEEVRKNRFISSKNNLEIFDNIFESCYTFDNNKDISYQKANMKEVDIFLESILNPVSFLKEKSLKKVKDYLYKNFMVDKDKNRNKPQSFHSDSPVKPDGYNEYDIRSSGQSNVISYNNEDIGSPENLSSLTGMSINPPDDAPRMDKFTTEPEVKKPKMYKRFNSPTKEELKNARIWKKTKEIIFR